MQNLDAQRSVGEGWTVFLKRVEGTAAIRLQKIQTFASHFLFIFIVILSTKLIGYVFGSFHQGKFARSLLVKILLAHSLSHAIQRRLHSIERDVDLHVVIDCLSKRQIFYD